jgi:hypothetical protein
MTVVPIARRVAAAAQLADVYESWRRRPSSQQKIIVYISGDAGMGGHGPNPLVQSYANKCPEELHEEVTHGVQRV